MKAKYLFFLLIANIGLCTYQSQAQRTELPYARTTATSARPTVHPEKYRRMYQIFVYKPRKVLYGNKCATDYTQAKGFEYVPVMADPSKHHNPLGVFFHNIWAKTVITFRCGLFWSVRTRRHIEQCRKSSGDFVGAIPIAPDSITVAQNP